MSRELGKHSIEDFLQQLADRTPTPGGGAVAATSLATAAAMAHMAVSYSHGRASLKAFDALHKEAMEKLSVLPSTSLQMAHQDAVAYGKLNDLWKLEEDDPIRQRDWKQAVQAAIDAPLDVMRHAREMLELLSRLVQATTPMLLSDLAVAAITAESAARSAHWNVLINLPSMADSEHAQNIRLDALDILDGCSALTRSIEQGCRAG